MIWKMRQAPRDPHVRNGRAIFSVSIARDVVAWLDRMSVDATLADGMRLSRSWVIEWCVRQVAAGQKRPEPVPKSGPRASRPARVIHRRKTPVDLH